MIEITPEMVKEARQLVENGTLTAAGYRVVIYPLEVNIGMDEALASSAPTLAAKGMQMKTMEQKDREDRGADYGVVIHVGDYAYHKLGGKWVEPGDVVSFQKYAGTRLEYPPSSGKFFIIVNDEDIYGKIL